MVRKFIWIGAGFLTMSLITACQNDNVEDSSLDISFEEVEAVYHENTPPLSADDYADLTAYAQILFQNRLYLVDEDDVQEIEKWFIRYYIQREEFQEDWELIEMIQLAEDRYIYEQAWRQYAEDEYGVSVTDEIVERQARYNVQVYENNTPALIEGMSAGLDKSLEEFLMVFDRDHAERTVIWQRLIPELLEGSQHDDSEYMSGVHLREQFDQEVEEYLNEIGEISLHKE
ncbi:hypothetical protein [Salisediminibacterium beveridgei]|uniref:Uncharacterized protein n=1 Tax=Salisediminibacterium beveridgei TaxID=632773 RepID=A0A1D7QTF1_9BACI|nr:hypothetical protein [Salisediminibacterium beveridgei]AOM82248.1 hypothetical protein BBEV_0877 [Salisediminibacterium beveridgei]